jgi:hypothetical protein
MAVPVKTSELPIASTLESGDRLVIVKAPGSTPNTATIDIQKIFANTSANVMHIQGPVSTPASSAAMAVLSGRIMWDANYLYIAVANNVLKRVELTSF